MDTYNPSCENCKFYMDEFGGNMCQLSPNVTVCPDHPDANGMVTWEDCL